MAKAKTKHTLLVGEGVHQHTLYGKFTVSDDAEYPKVNVQEKSLLKHEKPNGSFSNEHKALTVEVGSWVMGKQVEFDPFKNTVRQVWD